jgi:hypothetical protein
MLALSGVLALLLILTAVGMVAFRAFRLRGAGRQEMADFAAESGFYFAVSNKELVRRWSGSPFGQGDIRTARNVVTGYQQGRRVVAFDYKFGDIGRPSERYGVVVIRLKTGLPRIEVTDRRLADAVLDTVRTGRIEAESEQFNREFSVLAADQRYGHAMMHPRMMEFLLSQEPLPWRIEGADLICWAEGRLWPATVLERAEYLAGIAELIPAFVWADYGRDPQLS